MDLASFADKFGSSDQKGMLEELLKAHETIADDIKSGIKELSEANDCGSADILSSRLGFHEKTIWMLKATLE